MRCRRIFNRTVTLLDCVNKVNLETGVRASNQRAEIRHRITRNTDREDGQEGEGRDLELACSLPSGMCGKKRHWLGLW